MRRIRPLAPFVVALACASFLTPPAAAQQQRLVTIAARSCPSYEAVSANRARNNIMESLEDLGADTTYGVGGVPVNVDPAIEAATQPLCTAIANWQFTLGTGIQGRAVTGVWGSLSKVTGPFSPTIVTQERVPLRDGAGDPIDGAFVDGATTIELTPEQGQLASSGSRLWLQGGTPTLPITDPDTYGYAALRCATDNLNGDNVEFITYPPNVVHVFCFAYYVRPAPTSGTIEVVKQVTLPSGAGPQRVRFTGDISYENNEFFLTASNGNPGRTSFIRAAGRAWTFREDPQPLGTLTAINCVSQNGTSSSSTEVGTGAATVTLGAGDRVTCTYSNTYRRPPAGLSLRKVSLGGLGTFGFTIAGEGSSVAGATTTEAMGVATLVEPADEIAALGAGDYEVTEDLPPDRGGTWSFARASCTPGGDLTPENGRVRITVPAEPGTICQFTNTFTPAGRITLRKITLGAVATTRFQVRPQDGTVRPERQQLATTTEPGEPALAEGDDLDELPIGPYAIKETIGGPIRWEVVGVSCDDIPVPAIAGQIVITLTDDDPERDCTFINRRATETNPPDPAPPVPPPAPPAPPVEVGPPGGIAGAAEVGGRANLVVSKRARPRRVRIGGRLRFTVQIVNRGPVAADSVTLFERQTPVQRTLSLRSRDGTCRGRFPRFCRFGTMRPGERATVRVTVRTRRTGSFRNVVAVNSETAQRSRRAMRAAVRVRVTAPRSPRFTG